MNQHLSQHKLTEKFFSLSMLFNLEMMGKGDVPMLYQGQGNILMALGEQDGLSQKQLADKLSISSPSVNEFVNKLVKKQMVKKVHSKKDRRVVQIFLTDQGRLSLKQVEKEDLSGWSFLSAEQQTEFGELLDVLLKGLTDRYSDPKSKQQLASLRQQFLKRVRVRD
ncbi:MarR family winged helix-turn-helix transcriptional regulator [Pediococcus claussenii]|uniref:Transcriptional regulator, MarR family n=1 Tax=Pediococcus claussenii (strain ATCC BAA-344 / DSM 14800 / JCM 18046 / KCTC 3811 / LMG 21948 / P06) TaxID=701521 RepID=G8PBC2_PEDCP|nr:MarR family transcriptional regulator [Pediococcus claussenii]AEV95911.1 Transcriptional regulator, MarR family [Pediococcus claussenii ATCC BAA-344]ANZ69403.1 transcriptional regulator [Pediococcus claussenii]ANZ71223.1 transcriptional regulator [Pediococcus claussenii]KRN20516.1 hypothetical protein IV79_GL000573 [Pediococcus claussenii]